MKVVDRDGIKNNLSRYVEIVYKNFNDLANISSLKHNRKELRNLLSSDKLRGILVYNKQHKVIGYAFGQFMELDDGRFVYYLSYIYIIKKYRGTGLGSTIMDKLYEIAKQAGASYTLLICNTEDPKVYDFYLKRGFMPDLKLRRYEKHDVMAQAI